MDSTRHLTMHDQLDELADVDLRDLGQHGQRLVRVRWQFEANVFALKHVASSEKEGPDCASSRGKVERAKGGIALQVGCNQCPTETTWHALLGPHDFGELGCEVGERQPLIGRCKPCYQADGRLASVPSGGELPEIAVVSAGVRRQLAPAIAIELLVQVAQSHRVMVAGR